MRTRRAIVATYGVPEPDRDTGSRRVHDLVQMLLASGWSVSFVALNGIVRRHHAEALQQRGVPVFSRRDAEPLGSSAPMEAALDLGPCDLCLFAFWPVAERLMPLVRERSPRTRIIVDSIDLHLLREARRLLRPKARGAAGGVLGSEFGDQLIGELNTYAAADAVLTVSDKEAGLIDDLTACPGLAHAVGLVEDRPRSRVPFARRAGLLTLGNYQHLPNVHAVEYLCGEILPRLEPALLAEHPLWIVGAGLGESVRRHVDGSPHVRLVGWVPSLDPYLARARVSVVPLRYGAGAKGKVIEALMAGTPAVTTSVGVEGLGLEDGEHLLVADTPDRFAAAVTELLGDETLWKALARRGRSRVLELHGRAAVSRRFLDVVEAVLDVEPKPSRLPEQSAATYRHRLDHDEIQRAVTRVSAAVEATVPPGAVVAVATGGERWPLALGDRVARALPDPDARARAEGRARDEVAIEDLEELRVGGADYLLVPARAQWWLDRLGGLRRHLERFYHEVSSERDTGRIYALRSGNGSGAATGATRAAGTGRPEAPPAMRSPVRLIAFYLPQFHPIPENDVWWGPGFTEWSNVVQARSLFPGHRQPAHPTDLGFYDLRMPEARAAQAELARAHGIHGFCYYHYWFKGKRLLGRPFEEVLAAGEPDFPFCLCWANEPWSRRWDGSPEEVLQPQEYSPEDDRAHMEWLLPALTDPRAITVDDHPIFLVYQARNLPDPSQTAALWRQMAEDAGLPGLHLVAVETGWDAGWDATRVGFDAKVLFQPQFSLLRTTPRQELPDLPDLQVYDYDRAWPILANPEPVGYPRYDTLFPSWDNSPRTGVRSVVVHGSTPEAYGEWLRVAVERAERHPPGRQLVFLNAWNEWAEGCHLEPDATHGRAYLEATRHVVGAPPAGAGATAAAAPGAGSAPTSGDAITAWSFPLGDLDVLTGVDQEAALAAFETRLRRWAAATHAPPPDARPGVAVELPVTHGRWLLPCIESVVQQTSPHWHLYISAEGCDDLAARILTLVAGITHYRITVLEGGAHDSARARRALTAASSEPFILPLHEDDVLLPDTVERFLAEAHARPWFGLIRARRAFVDEAGHPLPREEWLPFEEGRYQHGMVQNVDNHAPPYLIARRIYDKTGGWAGLGPAAPGAEGCDIALQVEEHASIERVPETLYAYRVHERRAPHELTPRGGRAVWQQLADRAIARTGLPVRRLTDMPPFVYERRPAPSPDLSLLDVVIAFYESDEQELTYVNRRALASKDFEFVKLNDRLSFTQPLDAELMPCDRVELTCVLLTAFDSSLSLRITDPASGRLVAEGRTDLRFEEAQGLMTVRVALENRAAPVSSQVECTIACAPSSQDDASFNLVLQPSDTRDRLASMRFFRRVPGFSRRMLDRCLQSIRACGVADDAIHVVEKKQCAAANRNEGFRRTRRPYVCYADDDIEIVQPDALARLLRIMAETDAAVIGPRLVTDTGSIYCADPYFDEYLHPKPRGLGEPISEAYRYTSEVPWLPSTLTICRSAAVKAIGGFDDGYIGSQMEDVDFCLKIRQRGLTCVYAGGVDVVHYNYQRNDHFSKNFDRFSGRWRDFPALFAPIGAAAEDEDAPAIRGRMSVCP